MSRMSFSDAEYARKRKRTRREAFLAEMDKAVPWDARRYLWPSGPNHLQRQKLASAAGSGEPAFRADYGCVSQIKQPGGGSIAVLALILGKLVAAVLAFGSLIC